MERGENQWTLRESTDVQRAVTLGSPAVCDRNSVTNVIKNSRTPDLPIIPRVSGFDPSIQRGFQITERDRSSKGKLLSSVDCLR